MSARDDACIRLLAQIGEQHPGEDAMALAVKRTQADIDLFSSNGNSLLAGAARARMDWLRSKARVQG